MTQTLPTVSGINAVRLDRWLVSVRIFKTRSIAAKAIVGGKIKVNGVTAKAHRPLRIGEEISLKVEGRTHTYKVEGLLEKRVGAKDAVACYTLTVDADLPQEVREIMAIYREVEKQTPKTRGRPTKRDRRLIDKLQGDS